MQIYRLKRLKSQLSWIKLTRNDHVLDIFLDSFHKSWLFYPKFRYDENGFIKLVIKVG